MTKRKTKSKYFDKKTLDILYQASKEIVEIRNRVYKQIPIDLLDTDKISSLFIYDIVSKYDPDYNINFARNGEDAKSKDIFIEQKSTRVNGPLTKTGRPRKGAGTDACFQFHIMGDIDYPRYILVARDKDNLSVQRVYDISKPENQQKLLNYLLQARQKWIEESNKKAEPTKRDVMYIPETFILENLTLSDKIIIDGCVIMKD